MYLFNTNILIFFFKGNKKVVEKIRKVGLENCLVSEISIAELKYGAEKSERPKYHHAILNEFINDVRIIPVYNSLDVYAKEKSRLQKSGNRIDDFDLLIGSTAIQNNLILITNNTNHLNRIENIKIEDWTI